MNLKTRQRYQGFTLIELLVVIAIIGITLGIGLPSFQSIAASNKLTASANDMVVALQTARSESIKKMKFAGVSIHTDVNGNSPVDNNWIAFLNSSTLTTKGGVGTVIQNYAASSGVTVSSTDDTPSYRPDGRLTSVVPIVVTFTASGSDEQRTLTIQPSGRMNVTTP